MLCIHEFTDISSKNEINPDYLNQILSKNNNNTNYSLNDSQFKDRNFLLKHEIKSEHNLKVNFLFKFYYELNIL